MPDTDRELEVKFLIADLPGLRKKVERLGAMLVQPRLHEVNLRFDRRDGALKHSGQVLRLRQDHQIRLTYKAAGGEESGVHVRKEIEFTVGDFDAARHFLEALGFQVSMSYEKYRATYDLHIAPGAVVHVTLDEMPYGDFAELEGPDPQSIQRANALLGLVWEWRIIDSYTSLFDKICLRRSLAIRDLTFENFKSIPSPLDGLGLQPADRL